MTEITTLQVAGSIGISPQTRRFVLRDGDEVPYDGSQIGRAHV